MIVVYNESILAYIASIRKYYGLKSSFDSNEPFDELLNERKPKRIFLILIDGMGANLIKKKLADDSFINTFTTYTVSTVFPPTTTAATTSVRNGKAPNENAWLGWQQYFKEVDDNIIPFFNKGFYNNKDYEKDFASNVLPYKTMVDELNEKGIKARELFPSFREDGCESFVEMAKRLANYSNNKEYDFIYAYWDKYDTYMHLYGPSDEWCDLYLRHINECFEQLAEQLDEETMLVFTADHGQIDVEKNVNLYPKYHKYFYHDPALEFRSMAFYVKEELRDEFEKEFMNDFEDEFVLLTHKQVVDSRLFGTNKNHERFEEFIGDYLAIAKAGTVFEYGKEDNPNRLKGQHAGMCEDELMVPVGVFQK